MYRLGDKRKFNYPQRGEYILKEIVKQDLSLQWTWRYRICPHCQREINETKLHSIQEVHIWEGVDGKDVIMIAPTLDGKYMRLPDKKFEPSMDMTDKVKIKDVKLKNKIKEIKHVS